MAIKSGELWLLKVNNLANLYVEILVHILISPEDVFHVWTEPSLGLKTDATPGCLNQVTLTSVWPELHYGQCSEICGFDDSLVPIVLELVPLKHFENWWMTMI